jgi:hypothetical protein
VTLKRKPTVPDPFSSGPFPGPGVRIELVWESGQSRIGSEASVGSKRNLAFDPGNSSHTDRPSFDNNTNMTGDDGRAAGEDCMIPGVRPGCPGAVALGSEMPLGPFSHVPKEGEIP